MARTAPGARTVRRIRELREKWRRAGSPALYQGGAGYRPQAEGVFVTCGNGAKEVTLMWRVNKSGDWRIDDTIYIQDERPVSFLADLM